MCRVNKTRMSSRTRINRIGFFWIMISFACPRKSLELEKKARRPTMIPKNSEHVTNDPLFILFVYYHALLVLLLTWVNKKHQKMQKNHFNPTCCAFGNKFVFFLSFATSFILSQACHHTKEWNFFVWSNML